MKLALFAILKSNIRLWKNDDNAEEKELRGKGEKEKREERKRETERERRNAWRVPTWEKRDPVSSLVLEEESEECMVLGTP